MARPVVTKMKQRSQEFLNDDDAFETHLSKMKIQQPT